MSMARLTIAEDRVRRDRCRPSSVTPSTSSNSTEEPTTSSIRGRRLTLTPSDRTIRIASSVRSASMLLGTTMTRWMSCSTRTMPSVSIVPSGGGPGRTPFPSSSFSSSPSSGTRPTTRALTAKLTANLRLIARALSSPPRTRQRSSETSPRAMVLVAVRVTTSSVTTRPQSSPVCPRASSPSMLAPFESQIMKVSRVPTATIVGTSSSVVLRRRCSSRSWSPTILPSRITSGSAIADPMSSLPPLTTTTAMKSASDAATRSPAASMRLYSASRRSTVSFGAPRAPPRYPSGLAAAAPGGSAGETGPDGRPSGRARGCSASRGCSAGLVPPARERAEGQGSFV